MLDAALAAAAVGAGGVLAVPLLRRRGRSGRARVAALVESTQAAFVEIDGDGRVLRWNPAAERLFGYPEPLALRRRIVDLVVPPESRAQALDLLRQQPAAPAGPRHRRFTAEAMRQDGSRVPVEVFVTGLPGRRGVTFAAFVFDMTEQRAAQERLLWAATHDRLTELPDRGMFSEQLNRLLSRPERRAIGVLFLDLDNFKLVNDTYGHVAGDEVLVAVADRLRGVLRQGDIVARLGGDEFAVLLPDAETAESVANRIVETLREPVDAAGRRFAVHASAGLVLSDPAEPADAGVLLSHADIAMYLAKSRGKDRYVVLRGAAREAAARRVRISEQIVSPQLDQFDVLYQPIVDLESGNVRGAEALLRWHHPQIGEISPTEFVPLAEQGGAVSVLGRHVLLTACARLTTWGQRFPNHRLGLGVNLSASQLADPSLVRQVLDTAERLALQPDQLVLEVTEQAVLTDFDTARSVVQRLRDAGVSVAVDDFGTGYSSLRYLHELPADVVKIDRTFVSGLATPRTAALVRAIIHLARELDLQTIAEGVETEEQAAQLRGWGCELAQGFLFSHPVSHHAFAGLLGRADTFAHLLRPDPLPRLPRQHARGLEVARDLPVTEAGQPRLR